MPKYHFVTGRRVYRGIGNTSCSPAMNISLPLAICCVDTKIDMLHILRAQHECIIMILSVTPSITNVPLSKKEILLATY